MTLKQQSDRSNMNVALLFFAVAAFLVFAPDLMAGSAQNLPWEGPLEKIKSSLSGPWAAAISLMGVISAGASLIFQGDAMSSTVKTLMGIVLVIAIIISANSIISIFTADGAIVTGVTVTIL